MGRWSGMLAAEVIDWLELRAGLRWLDVGCGTGAASDAALEKARPMSLVVVESSAEYAAAARIRLNDLRVRVVLGTADELPLPDSCVDVAISGLVLNFVPDPEGAIREMRRVLVPGGEVVAYVWDYSDGMEMLRHFWDAARRDDPLAADLDEGTRFPICLPGNLAACLTAAGLDTVERIAIEVPTVFRDFDDYWTPFLGGQGPAARYVQALPPAAKRLLRSRLCEILAAEGDEPLRLSARAWVARGVST